MNLITQLSLLETEVARVEAELEALEAGRRAKYLEVVAARDARDAAKVVLYGQFGAAVVAAPGSTSYAEIGAKMDAAAKNDPAPVSDQALEPGGAGI